MLVRSASAAAEAVVAKPAEQVVQQYLRTLLHVVVTAEAVALASPSVQTKLRPRPKHEHHPLRCQIFQPVKPLEQHGARRLAPSLYCCISVGESRSPAVQAVLHWTRHHSLLCIVDEFLS